MASGLPPIVVPTDVSDSAAEALAYARRVALATGARVHLLHVRSWPEPDPFGVRGILPAGRDDEASEEDRLVEEALARAAGGDDVAPVIRWGQVPALEILDYVREVDAGLVVMGASGRRGGLGRLGSVTAEVVQDAPCDVLVVPRREGSPFSAQPPGRVLLAIDLSEGSDALLAFGMRFARDLGAGQVDVVHVLEPLPFPVRWIDETLLDLIPEIREREAEALRRLVDEEVESHPDGISPEVTVYVETGKPAHVLPRVAEALGTDLMVVGPHAGRRGLGLYLGSVAQGVTRRAACPVLIARQFAVPETQAEVAGLIPDRSR